MLTGTPVSAVSEHALKAQTDIAKTKNLKPDFTRMKLPLREKQILERTYEALSPQTKTDLGNA